MANILLDYMDNSGLYNKRSGQTIELDLRSLDQIGLTRNVLETIARGITDKAQLNKPRTRSPEP
jgi:hypothetical protein